MFRDVRAVLAGMLTTLKHVVRPAVTLDYPDVKRTERFVQELKRFEQEGDMPRLQVIRLPNDHTYGTTVGKLTYSCSIHGTAQSGTVTVTRQSRVSARWRGRPAASGLAVWDR